MRTRKIMNTGDEFNNNRKKRCAEGMIIQIENLFNYLSEKNSYFIKNIGQFIIIKQI